jgi:hypothetical protein
VNGPVSPRRDILRDWTRTFNLERDAFPEVVRTIETLGHVGGEGCEGQGSKIRTDLSRVTEGFGWLTGCLPRVGHQ